MARPTIRTSTTSGLHEPWTRGERVLMLVLGGVSFLDALDSSLTQVALPSIGRSLHLHQGDLQWIVSAFVLGYGGFLLLGGRCADLFGRKRVLIAGLIALTIASAAGAVAGDGTLLIAARFVKGVSAGFTAPAGASILTNTFAEGSHRNRALGAYTASAAAGFIFGLVSGGLLTQLSWRLTFAVVVPAAIIALLAVVRVVRPDSSVAASAASAAGRLDAAGAVLITAAALLFVWAVVQAPTDGIGSARTLGGVAGAAALLAAFLAAEARIADPLVRMALLRSGPLMSASLGALLLFGCATVYNVTTTLYEQNVLHWTPLRAGLVFVVAGVSTALVAPRVGRLATHLGVSVVLLGGALLSLAAYLVWMLNGVHTSYPVLLISLALQGAGFALVAPALNIQALTGVAEHEQGVVIAVIGSCFQLGGAILLAIATAVSLAVVSSQATGARYLHGLHAGMYVALAGAVMIALIAIRALAQTRQSVS